MYKIFTLIVICFVSTALYSQPVLSKQEMMEDLDSLESIIFRYYSALPIHHG